MKIQVAVRVRPFLKREVEMGAQSIVYMENDLTRLIKPTKLAASVRESHNDFSFDHSYWSFDEKDDHYADQDQVFRDLGSDVVNSAFQGYNCCCFAYGQTGSGKTFTMMGTKADPQKEGLVPRICQALFNRMNSGQDEGTGYKTQVSYLEIYNEKVKDLLSTNRDLGHNLKVREHKISGPYVENLSQHPVSDYSEILACMNLGNIQRTTASTNMNDTSSRSHAIFTITFVKASYLNVSETTSKIHLVDLAGSERANSTGATGTRLKEGAHINKSLVTLGSVISALAEMSNPTNANKRILYIPYRDSILTWLLKDSLGGNSKTIMIAAISPADCNYSETLSTLRYANRAKNIVCKPSINEDPNVKLIKDLRDEIMALKNLLSTENVQLKAPALKMLEDLKKKEEQEKSLTNEWTEKWRDVQKILREEKSLGLKKSGVGVTLDSEVPHLIGINDNISGVTLYSLKEGKTSIGTDEAEVPRDIILPGMGILPEHCHILLEKGFATIHPNESSQCWLNANLIDQPTPISQGDILLLGRTNMFRYNNPSDVGKTKRNRRLDISRLSLIAASRENLCSSFMSEDGDVNSMFSSNLSPFKNKMIANHEDLQDEHKKILQTIENALKQLNIERVQMHEHYKNKVRRYTCELERIERLHFDSMSIMDCKMEELLAKREMLFWEKNNEKTQVEILSRQITAITTQLDGKLRDFYDSVAKELQELQDCGRLNEESLALIRDAPNMEDYSEVLLEVSKSLDSYSSQYLKENIKKNRDEIQKYEDELLQKDKMLEDCVTKIAQLDEKLLSLEEENRVLVSKRGEMERAELQQRKQSMSLNLKETSNMAAQTDTAMGGSCESSSAMDTFHTANSECSFASALPSPSVWKNLDDESILPTPAPSPMTESETSKHVMSDSGVCLESSNLPKHNSQQYDPLQNNKRIDDDNTSTNSSQTCYENFLNSHMTILRNKMAVKKAEIMGCLGEKNVLDVKINELQELQKDYVKLEMRLQECNGRDGCFSEGDVRESDSDEYRTNPMVLSAYSTRNNSMTASLFNPYAMTRSLPTIEGSTSSLYNRPEPSEHIINIPSFLIRGAGKQTHTEYEVRISLSEDSWILLRRYSRFRELHLSMKAIYGQKISKISFPNRELFGSNSEKTTKARRRQLETYLRRLLVICSRISSSPIFDGEGGPGVTKTSLIEFSSFFKKGLFENSKYGTG